MRRIFACGLVAGLLAACGCATPQNARYIYQDGDFGVIGIPQNSPYGSKDYRQQADELMHRHFPQGYEIVRAEEVVEGQRVLDKSRKSEFETDPSFISLSQKINVAKLAQSSSTQQKDSLPILESRIIYRRRTPEGPRGVNGYASSAEVIPKFYLDPNEMARCREQIELAELKKPKPAAQVAEKKSDAAVQKATSDAGK